MYMYIDTFVVRYTQDSVQRRGGKKALIQPIRTDINYIMPHTARIAQVQRLRYMYLYSVEWCNSRQGVQRSEVVYNIVVDT